MSNRETLDDSKWGEATQEVLYDSAYMAGMKHGWNCAVAGDEEAYRASMESRVNERVAAAKAYGGSNGLE